MLAPGSMVVSFRAVLQAWVMLTRQLATNCKRGVVRNVMYGIDVKRAISMAEADR